MRREDVADGMIWSQFKNGDKEAFAKLYQLHITSLIYYGAAICNNEEILKDCIQDLFVELWHARENLAPVDSVKFYLFSALRYKLIRELKKRQQQDSLSFILADDPFSSFDNPVETAMIDKEIHDSQVYVLGKALKTLSKRQQEVIQLRFYQGFTTEQIASLMNMNYQSVSNLLYNALCRIKKNLKAPVLVTALAILLYLFC